MSAAPTISAIVPVYNGAAHIGDALRSIRAQLHPVTELIVVDDGSTDDTADVVRRVDPAATVIRLARNGPAAARNTGAQSASGDWLAFLDHDDIWPSDRTGALLDAVTTSPHAGMICGRVRIKQMPAAPPDPRLQAVDGTHVPFSFPSALLRRSVWTALRGMDGTFDRAEDVDLYLRLVESGVTVVKIDAVTLIYRQHGGNRSRHVALSNASMLAMMRATIARRRAKTF